MREIKFRSWNGERMQHGGFSIHATGDVLADSLHGAHPINVMQYTGLKDANGVEIYEGDIVSWNGAVCYIAWEDSDASFMAVEQYDTWAESGQEWASSCKVIGNIYQNNDLLNG